MYILHSMLHACLICCLEWHDILLSSVVLLDLNNLWFFIVKILSKFLSLQERVFLICRLPRRSVG